MACQNPPLFIFCIPTSGFAIHYGSWLPLRSHFGVVYCNRTRAPVYVYVQIRLSFLLHVPCQLPTLKTLSPFSLYSRKGQIIKFLLGNNSCSPVVRGSTVDSKKSGVFKPAQKRVCSPWCLRRTFEMLPVVSQNATTIATPFNDEIIIKWKESPGFGTDLTQKTIAKIRLICRSEIKKRIRIFFFKSSFSSSTNLTE